MRIVLLGLMPVALLAQQSVEFVGRYWMSQMGGLIRVEAGGFGTDIDPRHDLGLGDTGLPEGDFTWRKGRSLLLLSFTPIDYSGDRTVSRTLEFRGRQYTVGTRIVSNLDIKTLELGWAYQFGLREGIVRVGPLVGADGFLMHGSLVAPEFSIAEKEDLSVGLPVAGLALDITPRKWVDVYGRARGMDVGTYGYYIGSDAGLKLTVKHVVLTAGYRTFNLHVENSPDFARVRVRGPVVGMGFGW